MTIRRLNRPFTFNNDFDRFFNDFFNAPTQSGTVKRKTDASLPAVNIEESEEAFHISVAAPGKQKEDFNIEIHDGIMSISSEESTESTSEEPNFTRREFNYSSFERRFTLPENIAEDNVKAEYVDGILKIAIPKVTEQPKENKKTITIS